MSVFQNGVLIPYSTRTCDINTSALTLKAIASVSTGQEIDVYWTVDTGGVVLGNRILTLLRLD